MDGHGWASGEGEAEERLSEELPPALRGPPALEEAPMDDDDEDDRESDTGEGGGGESSSESSDSGSSNTSSTSTGSSSSVMSAMTARAAGGVPMSIWETDEFGQFIPVNCNNNEAHFYLNRFSRGSVGRCVLFRGRWITPNEFQAISGRQSSKDWKRSIRLRGRCLKEFIAQGLFQEHPKTCTCKVCAREDGWMDAELRRQEGEMALAAKRRRLSQADGGAPSAPPPPPDLREARKPGPVKKRRGRPPKRQKVWSPSGEIAHDVSSNDEEQKPEESSSKPAEQEEEEEEEEAEEEKVVEEEAEEEEEEEEEAPLAGHSSRTTPRRRSQRTVNRKRAGHRTELGTFTRRPADWDCEEVAEFLTMHGFPELAEPFTRAEIGGEALFLLQEHHLIEHFHMKLGPGLKLLDTISRLKHPPL